MHVQWLLERHIFDYAERLVAEAARQRLAIDLMEYREGADDEAVLRRYPPDACVVAHGSLGLGVLLAQRARWTPGVWCNLENMRYRSYAGPWSEFLLNREATLLSYGEFVSWYGQQIEAGRATPLFVRPDSGAKEFSGMVVTPDNFEQLTWYRDELPSELGIVTAAAQEIGREWRFVVVGDRVVTGCEYALIDGRRQPRPGYPTAAAEFAGHVAAGPFRPDSLYVLDICEKATPRDRYAVLEPNTFSCSDWYACDLSTILREGSASALSEWQIRDTTRADRH